jgi:hypothetical protein
VAALVADEVDGHGLAIEIERQPRPPAPTPASVVPPAERPRTPPEQPGGGRDRLLEEVVALRARVAKLGGALRDITAAAKDVITAVTKTGGNDRNLPIGALQVELHAARTALESKP